MMSLSYSIFTIIPTRHFNVLYVVLDTLFILVLLGLLWWKKKKSTFYFALFGGILYFLVDYGYFYYISHTRTVMIHDQVCNGFQTGAILLWMSLSYGITNFAFIWLCVKKDEYVKEFLFLIVGWWLIVPSLSSLGGGATITTSRTTLAYHGWMAVILAIGYLAIILYNFSVEKNKRISLFWLNAIGIGVQFAWEFALLINGIRPMNAFSIQTIVINSLIETNLGMPIIYGIYILYKKRYQSIQFKTKQEVSNQEINLLTQIENNQ